MAIGTFCVEDRDKLDAWLYILLELSLYQCSILDKIPSMLLSMKLLELPKTVSVAVRKICQCDLRKIRQDGAADQTTINRKNKRYSVDRNYSADSGWSRC